MAPSHESRDQHSHNDRADVRVRQQDGSSQQAGPEKETPLHGYPIIASRRLSTQIRIEISASISRMIGVMSRIHCIGV